MSTAAGSVTVVLSTNSTSFSAGLTDAQRQLDKFANSSKAASHGTVSGMQAASASIRLLDNPLGNNVRAIERLISQSQILSGVLKAAFPLVGAIAIGAMVARLATQVSEFVTKVNGMPAAITKGFGSLNLSATSTNDELERTGDLLQNNIAKLSGKPQNNVKIAFDDAKIAADKLAESIDSDNDKLNDLLSKNHLSDLATLMNTASTNDREGTVKYYGQQQIEAGLRYEQAVHDRDDVGAKKALADLKASQDSELRNVTTDAANRRAVQGIRNSGGNAPDQSADINIDTGVATNILKEQNRQTEQLRVAALDTENKKAEAAKAAAAEAKKQASEALEARKKAAEDQLQQWESDNSDWKAEQDRSLTDDAAWWKAKLDTLNTGSLNYRAVNKKVNADIIADNRESATAIAKFTDEYHRDFIKSSGLSSTDTNALGDSGKAAAEYIAGLRASIDLNRENATAIAESSIQMQVATGQMTRLDGARTLANLHTQQYNASMSSLADAKDFVNSRTDLTPIQKQAQTIALTNQGSALQGQRTLQMQQDQASTNPQASLASVGFVDALDEFVTSTRDAAAQMKEITTSTLSTLNAEFVKGISGQRTDFGNAGASILRNVAGQGIQKAEGSVLGALGFGGSSKLGTKSNPMYTISTGVSENLGNAGSLLSGLFGKKSADTSALSSAMSGASRSPIATISSDLTSLIPGFASGGYAAAGTLAMVGEQGPELAYFGSGANITPNHKISSVLNAPSGVTHNWNIDATGSTDPAQTQAAVQRGIKAAAPHIMAGAVQATNEQQKRRPSSAR